MSNVVAMILAGGQGKRMDILCHTRPKPALPFAGRFRVIDFSLSNCIHSHIGNVAVLIDYQRSRIASYLRQWKLTNSEIRNLDILEPKNGSYKGTADAVFQNLDHLQKHNAERIMILAGDHVYKMDYRKMLAFHEQANADVTVGVAPVPFEQAHRFGTVALDAESRVINFVEKSDAPQSNLASMGIYIFNKDVLLSRLMEDSAEPNSPHDFGYAILPAMMAKRDRVFAYRFDGYWQDIGTVEAYYEANMQLIRQPSSFSLNGTWPIFTGDNNLVATKQLPQGSVENSLISPGCVIKGRVENSVLSPGVWVDEQAVVKNSILLSNAFVGHHSLIDTCILDDGVNIGNFCYIGFRTGQTHAENNITVLGKDAAIPPHTAVGRNCRILPNTGIADFLTNVISSGSLVSPRSKDDRIFA